MMDYGCIGKKLGHSFSKEIHGKFADYDYRLAEIEPEALDEFMKCADFRAINVTIPYKTTVIPYLSYMDEGAKKIGAVNTIVNRDGKLYGYNTDFYGMTMLLSHAGIKVFGMKVLILGTGGTSKTAMAVAESLGAEEIIRASRTKKDGALSYEDVYQAHTDANIIINTTPVGMYPNIFDAPIDLSKFENLCGVIDAIYNPLRTTLISDAMRRGIPAEGGLYMLVAQAVRAGEIFLGMDFPRSTLDETFDIILKEKENIVLVGMPASGKSTVGKMLSEMLGRKFIDSDTEIELAERKSILDIFKDGGESHFRDIEAGVIREISRSSGAVIATGGGSVLRNENVLALKQNGRLYFVDRPPEALIPTSDRPLSSNAEDIMMRYYERYDIYTSVSDVVIDANCDAEYVKDKISKEYTERKV